MALEGPDVIIIVKFPGILIFIGWLAGFFLTASWKPQLTLLFLIFLAKVFNLKEVLLVMPPVVVHQNGADISLKTSRSQPAFTCSKLTIGILEQGVKYVQS